MRTYEIKFARSVQKDLRKLTPDVQKRVLRAIAKLGKNPRKGNVRPMVGSTAWRLRVGDYRVIYDIHDGELVILVIRISHRRDVYKSK